LFTTCYTSESEAMDVPNRSPRADGLVTEAIIIDTVPSPSSLISRSFDLSSGERGSEDERDRRREGRRRVG
jgi:hypothetical protein